MATKKFNMKKFNIKMLKEIDACTSAQKQLFKRFEGQTNVDLSTRKNDFINLIDEGRGDWVVFFCLSVMRPSQQYDFLRFCLDDIKQNFKGQVVDQACYSMNSYIDGKGDKQELQNMGKKFASQADINEKQTLLEKCHSKLSLALEHYILSSLGGKIQHLIIGHKSFIESLIIFNYI